VELARELVVGERDGLVELIELERVDVGGVSVELLLVGLGEELLLVGLVEELLDVDGH